MTKVNFETRQPDERPGMASMRSLIHNQMPPNVQKDAEERIHFLESIAKKMHLREMTVAELMEVLKVCCEIKQDYSPYARFDYSNRQHRYIMSIAHQIGWSHIVGSKSVVDSHKLGHWLAHYGFLKLPVAYYLPAELGKLIKQMEKVFENYLKPKQNGSK